MLEIEFIHDKYNYNGDEKTYNKFLKAGTYRNDVHTNTKVWGNISNKKYKILQNTIQKIKKEINVMNESTLVGKDTPLDEEGKKKYINITTRFIAYYYKLYGVLKNKQKFFTKTTADISKGKIRGGKKNENYENDEKKKKNYVKSLEYVIDNGPKNQTIYIETSSDQKNKSGGTVSDDKTNWKRLTAVQNLPKFKMGENVWYGKKNTNGKITAINPPDWGSLTYTYNISNTNSRIYETNIRNNIGQPEATFTHNDRILTPKVRDAWEHQGGENEFKAAYQYAIDLFNNRNTAIKNVKKAIGKFEVIKRDTKSDTKSDVLLSFDKSENITHFYMVWEYFLETNRIIHNIYNLTKLANQIKEKTFPRTCIQYKMQNINKNIESSANLDHLFTQFGYIIDMIQNISNPDVKICKSMLIQIKKILATIKTLFDKLVKINENITNITNKCILLYCKEPQLLHNYLKQTLDTLCPILPAPVYGTNIDIDQFLTELINMLSSLSNAECTKIYTGIFGTKS